MDFRFTEQQHMFLDSVQELFASELPAETVRQLWSTETGEASQLWQKFAGLGLLGMLVTEQQGGLDLSEIDFVLLAEQCGRAAVPEPLVDTVLVTVPLLAAIHDKQLAQVIDGSQRVALGNPFDPFVDRAAIARRWLLPGTGGDEIHLLEADDDLLQREHSVDPSRRLYRIDAELDSTSCVVSGDQARSVWYLANLRGALGVAAQQLGATQQMLDMAVAYCCERQQFGVPVGTFQAVKHLLADVQVKLTFARPVVYRASWELARRPDSAAVAVSHAFVAASEAALLAARNCMQVHGAMGYTWELDLHIWMKRVWVLDKLWGGQAYHRARLAQHLLARESTFDFGEIFSE